MKHATPIALACLSFAVASVAFFCDITVETRRDREARAVNAPHGVILKPCVLMPFPDEPSVPTLVHEPYDTARGYVKVRESDLVGYIDASSRTFDYAVRVYLECGGDEPTRLTWR